MDQPNPKEPIAKRDVPLVYADAIVVSGRKVGYLPSYDRPLNVARGAGRRCEEVDCRRHRESRICQDINTIIIDNRGYEAHQELVPVNNRLLKFVDDGGTLLVFYHRTNEWNPNESARPAATRAVSDRDRRLTA